MRWSLVCQSHLASMASLQFQLDGTVPGSPIRSPASMAGWHLCRCPTAHNTVAAHGPHRVNINMWNASRQCARGCLSEMLMACRLDMTQFADTSIVDALALLLLLLRCYQHTTSPRSTTFSPRTRNTPRGMSPNLLPTKMRSIASSNTMFAA
jgi:hypothetical protein